MEVFSQIVKVICEDGHLLQNRVQLIDALGVAGGVVPLLRSYELGQCRAYDHLRGVLSEWILVRGDSATISELRKILVGNDFIECSDNLQKLEEMYPEPIKIHILSIASGPLESPQPQVQTKPITFGVKKVVLNFMGREEELDKLNEHFHSGECQIVCISGLGGIGKTELTKKFALSISYPSGNTQIDISWLSGETPQTILNSCSKFCLHLGLSATDPEGKPLQMKDMLENIKAKLNSSRWLVIIDNVDEIHEEFQNAVKILCDSGSDVFILVTSRRRDIFPGELELLEVNPLKLEDSVQFVKKSLKIDDNSSEDAFKSLCLQLGNFPLALGQAVAFIKQQQSMSLKGMAYGIQNYLDELAKTETLGLDTDSKLSEYSTATLKVWNITLDKILDVYGAEGKMTLHLLDVIAFINPEDIRITSLEKLLNRFYPSTKFKFLKFFRNIQNIHRFYTQASDESRSRTKIEFCLTLLLQYSLISSFDDAVSIHRLVQLSLRDRMTSNKKDVEMLTTFWNSFERKDWNLAEMQNILTVWNHSKTHRDLDALRAAKIQDVFFQLWNLEMVKECYDFASEGCKFLQAHYGSEHQEYLFMEQALAMAMQKKGQYEESFEKLTFVHEKLKKLSGEDAAVIWCTTYNIADALYELNRFEDCLEWAQEALQSSIRIYGENNDATMRTKNLVALALQNLGRIEEALEILYEIWAWEEVNLGRDHPSTHTTRHNIAICLFNEGMFAEALDIFQAVLIIRENLFGAENPDTLKTKGWAADTLYEMGKGGKSLKIWEEVLTSREKVLGPQHPRTINARERVTDLSSKLKV